MLIGGTNGAGKTTLFESIILCLYGISTFDKKMNRSTYDKYLAKKIHRYSKTHITADQASVIIEFQFSHNGKMTEYHVDRTWNNHNGKITEQLTVKKKDIHAKQFEVLDKIEESYWQSFIENLIPRGIANLFFFDGEKIVKMVEDANTDIIIRSSFNSLLGLDIVDQLREDLQKNLMKNLTGKEKHLEDEFNKYTKEKEELERKNERMIEKQVKLESDIVDAHKEIDDLESKMSKIGGEFAIKRDELKSNKAIYELKIETISNEIQELCSASLPFSLIPDQLKEIQDQIQEDMLIVKAKMENDILNDHIRKLNSTLASKKLWIGLELNDFIRKTLTSKIAKMMKPKYSKQDKTELYNFSSSQSSKILHIIHEVNDSISDLEDNTQKFITINDKLIRTDTALINAPNDDEIGPMISKLGKKHSASAILQAEVDHMEQEISGNHALIRHINVQIRNVVSKRYENKQSHRITELTEMVQTVLDKYAKKLRDKKMRFLEEYLLDAIHILLHKKTIHSKSICGQRYI